MASEIERINGNHPQPWQISEQIVDYTNVGIRAVAAKGKTIEPVVALEQAKAMMETVRGQIS
jgi:hypothetical protein